MKTFLTCLLLAAATASATFSLYGWNDIHRPPVSLNDALAEGTKLLGDDAANYYCVGADLYGNREGDGKEGAWNILYAANDGSRKHVYVNMRSEASIKNWNGPVDWKKNDGRRNDVADVKNRLVELLKSNSIEFEINEDSNDRLTISSSTREFRLHEENDDGSYSANTVAVIGPNADGVWIDVRLREKQPPEFPYRWQGPYWRMSRGNYILTNGKGFLTSNIRYGNDFSSKIVDQMNQIMGDPVK